MERIGESMARKIYRVNEEEKKYLVEKCGHREEDLRQIGMAYYATNYEFNCTNKVGVCKVSAETARDLLGFEEFWSGLSRSAFHSSAVRDIDDDRYVYFDTSRLFQ